MLMNIISRIKNYFRPIEHWKLYARSNFIIKKQGMLTYDNAWIEFRDPETKRRYMLRPIGMPLPLIVDELNKITGNRRGWPVPRIILHPFLANPGFPGV